MATHSSILAKNVSRREESIASQKVSYMTEQLRAHTQEEQKERNGIRDRINGRYIYSLSFSLGAELVPGKAEHPEVEILSEF